jgi:ubiquinone/menaquinone biosynthesis C-methylase UbiE
MNEFSREAIRQSGYLRDGFAAFYDENRLRPPDVLLNALARYAGGVSLERVVDLGSGTGLSARAWSDRSGEVVGVEPNESMLSVALAQTSQTNVRYIRAFADATGLPDESADLVTCSQSFHWMDREPVLAEATRVLRSGGAFAAYDYDMPPLVHPDVDAAFRDHLDRRGRYRDEHKVEAGWTRAVKASHLDAICESGHFAYTREAVFHDTADVDADRIIGLARSLGLVPELLALGISEEALGLTALEETTRRVLGERRVPWVVGYRVRLGVKPAR